MMTFFFYLKIFTIFLIVFIAIETWSIGEYHMFICHTLYKRIKLYLLLKQNCQYFLMRNLDTNEEYITIIYQQRPEVKYFTIEERLFNRWYPAELIMVKAVMTKLNTNEGNENER